MSKRVIVNEYDFDTQIEEVRSTWADGSTIIVRNNTKKGKSKVIISDCRKGKRDVIKKKFDFDLLLGNIEAVLFLNDWAEKFDDANK